MFIFFENLAFVFLKHPFWDSPFVLLPSINAIVSWFKIRKVKDSRRKFSPRRNLFKLHEGIGNKDFSSYTNKHRESYHEYAFVEGYQRKVKKKKASRAVASPHVVKEWLEIWCV